MRLFIEEDEKSSLEDAFRLCNLLANCIGHCVSVDSDDLDTMLEVILDKLRVITTIDNSRVINA